MKVGMPGILRACFGHKPNRREKAAKIARAARCEIEALEGRMLLSFQAHMTGAWEGALAGYSVSLYVTGGIASQWTVHWGDGNSNTYLASQQPGGAFDYAGSVGPSARFARAARMRPRNELAMSFNSGTRPRG